MRAWMSKALLQALPVAAALLFMQCGFHENPLISDRVIAEVPVSSLEFAPARKYVTRSESVPVLVKG